MITYVSDRAENIDSLPNDKILARSKLKAFADKLNVTEKLKFVLGKVESNSK